MSGDDRSTRDREPPGQGAGAHKPGEDLPPLEDRLRVYLNDFREQGGGFRALQSIAEIGWNLKADSGGADVPQPRDEDMVPVARWAIEAVAEAIGRFIDGHKGRDLPCTLGQAFEAEPPQVEVRIKVPPLLEKLRQGLIEAGAVYDLGVSPGERFDGGRTGAMLAVHHVIEFLRRITFSLEAQLVLLDLAIALRTVDQGGTHAMFLAKRPSHRPPDTDLAATFKAVAAAAMEFLIRAGDDRRTAAQRVARRLLSHGYEIGPGAGHAEHWVRGSDGATTAWRTVANWRDRFNGHSGDSYGVEQYRNLTNACTSGHLDPAQAAENLLDGLPDHFPPGILNKPPSYSRRA